MIYITDTVLSWLERLGYPDWVRTKCVERSLVSALVDRKPGASDRLLREAPAPATAPATAPADTSFEG